MMENNDLNKTLQTYRDCVKNLVSAKRYSHTLAVEQQAKKLAKIYGADEFKASVAAILHDIAKEMPPEKQLDLIETAGVEFGENEHQNQKLWHAAAGAAWINGRAGEIAAERKGEVSMTAGNTIEAIAEAIAGLIR